MTRGILITNIGTPESPTAASVRKYLKEFLSDPRVVEIPQFLWVWILHGFILPTRSAQSAKLYKKIWTEQGSPLLEYSKKIASLLENKLKIPVVLGMHYGNPSIKSALEELKSKQVEEITVLPLYPQYSATTTAVSFDQVADVLKTWRHVPSLKFISDYAKNHLYIESLVHSIQEFQNEHGKPQHLLFSFHGIPERFVNLGDPYAAQCRETARLIAKRLNLSSKDWGVSFQSRLGRAKWLTPYTDKVLLSFPKAGITHLQVVCPGFAVDCLETLEEIALRGKEQFLQAKGKNFQYIPALNDSDEHIEMLAHLINQ